MVIRTCGCGHRIAGSEKVCPECGSSIHRSRDPILVVIALFVLGMIALFVLGRARGPAAPPLPSTAPQTQTEREAYIHQLERDRVVHKIEITEDSIQVYVGDDFYDLPSENQQRLLEVIDGYYRADHPGLEAIQLKDWQSGDPIGRYDPAHGLELSWHDAPQHLGSSASPGEESVARPRCLAATGSPRSRA